MAINCPTGLLSMDTKGYQTDELIFDAGIIPDSSLVNNYCSNSAFNDARDCSSYIGQHILRKLIEENCIGKKSCVIGDLHQFINMNIRQQDVKNDCFSDESHFFIQMAC